MCIEVKFMFQLPLVRVLLFPVLHIEHLHAVLRVDEQVQNGFLVVGEVLLVDLDDVLEKLKVLHLPSVVENEGHKKLEMSLSLFQTQCLVVAENLIE